jgi:hypothetical protein
MREAALVILAGVLAASDDFDLCKAGIFKQQLW